MGIKIEKLTDYVHLQEGDMIFFPAESSNKRKVRLAAKSLAKFGISVGSTCRSENNEEYLNKFVHDLCEIPLIFKITKPCVRYYFNERRMSLLRNTSKKVGPDCYKYHVSLANYALDPRLSKRSEPNNQLDCVYAFKDSILDALIQTLSPTMVAKVQSTLRKSKRCFESLLITNRRPVPDTDVLSSEAFISERSSLPRTDAEKAVYDKYIFSTREISFTFTTKFISEIAKRGAVVFRSTGLGENVARRIVNEIYARASANHAENAVDILNFAKELLKEAKEMTKLSQAFKTLRNKKVAIRKSDLVDIEKMINELGKKVK